MRTFVLSKILTISLLVAALTPLSASVPEEITSANDELATGHVSEALASYQKILASPDLRNQSSPEIWYHQGLAQEKLNDPIAASLSFRRALLLDPALQPAQKKLASTLKSLGVIPSTGYRERLWRILSPEVLILGGALLGWIGVFSLVVFLMLPPRRPVRIALALVVCIAGHGLSLFGSLLDPRRTAPDAAVVTAKSAPALRTTPADNGTVSGKLTPGSQITVLSRNGDWWYVSDGLGHTGWIPATTVTPLLPGSAVS